MSDEGVLVNEVNENKQEHRSYPANESTNDSSRLSE
ncbi:hypothetical protein ZOD2009_05282 [Haladaptatus paucihalophilus DX253]|uniref:Uncharacterized protein n=1 Tax=Haladaptatus paucihalophilus DX253 TaxID=797209 RepID=E7QQI6_HALPU|nr:hypothetical protein ZOD2009_05282 [Haladaptatus paucihalophilus DX253]